MLASLQDIGMALSVVLLIVLCMMAKTVTGSERYGTV
jgi:hypothetical protein